MKRTPPYHLRSAKAVDRLLLIEAISKVIAIFNDEASFKYIGFGGPFLEDFKIVNYFFPRLPLVSIEREFEIIKRQRFHRFCSDLRLKHTVDIDFFRRMDEGERVICWLDYTNLRASYLESLQTIVKKAGTDSIVKITLPAALPSESQKRDILKYFDDFLPQDRSEIFSNSMMFHRTLFEIVRRATAPVPGDNTTFHIFNSSVYEDGAKMWTATGIKVKDSDLSQLLQNLRKWPFYNDRQDPTLIDIPELSILERSRLSRLLPKKTAGSDLRKSLGYLLDDDEARTDVLLGNFALFARHQPTFVKAVF